jgi:hypothetical protein
MISAIWGWTICKTFSAKTSGMISVIGGSKVGEPSETTSVKVGINKGLGRVVAMS